MATLLPNGKQAFTTGAGIPLVGGKLYTYAAGTNTPAPTWSDAAQTATNTNPVVLDARGEASIFWNGTYKVILRDAAGNLIWTQDNVGGSSSVSVTTLTSLSASGVSSSSAVVTQVGREGVFSFNPANLATRVAADPAQAVFVAPAIDPTGASGAWVRQGAGNLDAQWFGALSGQTSTTAIAQALVMARDNPQAEAVPLGQQPAVELDPGIYDAGDIAHNIYTAANASGTSNLILRAKQPGTVIIKIPDGKFFLTVDGRYQSIDIRGIIFVGGAGTVKFTNTGNNVNGFVWFERCVFYRQTVCSIGNMADDAPYLRVRDCIFDNTSTSIGVAWGGYCDLMVIEGNQFLRNRYHLAIGPRLSGSINILRNDFIKNGDDFYRTADIWIKPNLDAGTFGASSGQGSTIAFNKFGNENLSRYERRIIIAAEDTATGTDRLTYQHSTASAPGYCSGFAILWNLIATKYIAGTTIPDGNDAPFLGTYCPNTWAFRFQGNIGAGGRYQWLAFFYNLPDQYSYYAGQSWEISNDPSMMFQYGVVNTRMGVVHDPAGMVQGDRYAQPPYYAGGDDGSFVKFDGTTNAGMGAAVGAVISAGPTDRYNGSSLITATLPTGGALIYGSLNPTSFADYKHWIEIELAPVADATRQLREVTLDVRNYATGQVAMTRTLQVQQGTFGPIEFTMPAAAGAGNENAWQWRITPAFDTTGSTFNQVVMGRVFVSVGREPFRTRNLATVGGRFNTPHVVLGPFHLWFDANSRLRRKGDGPPTADLQGDAFPITGAAQANSTATTVAGLVSDFNALLDKLRSSGALSS